MNSKKILLNAVLLLISIFAGFWVNKAVIGNIIGNIGYGNLEMIGQMSILFSMIIIFFILLRFIFKQNQRIDNKILAVVYLVLLLIVVFGKNSGYERKIGLNPFSFIYESFSSKRVMVVSVMNFMMLTPIPFIIHNKFSMKKQFLIGLIVSLLIELSQLVFSVGIFDLSDIVLYMIGFTVSYYFLNNIVKSKKNEKTNQRLS